ncbi:MAG: thiamine phosphate synthase [Pirellulaceae bacterium]|jgi:thiamine-phosphate pyrophosphorylase|nr:thiamine phosphate synthase [Pirellulaceae bacterium]MDP7016630.1 thiamine phosphate synthase [Pirellulaceae bacterium]
MEHSPDPQVLRILDANWNRAAEGARVVEDFARFALEDAHLSEQMKQLRHDLAAILHPYAHQLKTMRDTQGDVGASVTTPTEYDRAGIVDVLDANLSRVEQSLRALEEFGKVVSPTLGGDMERLRYGCYRVGQALRNVTVNRDRLAETRLYVIVDGRGDAGLFAATVSDVCAAADAIQLRDKTASDRELLERALVAVRICRQTDTLCVINDRPDIAAVARADGVHVGQDEMPVSAARQIVGPNRLVGVSTHSIEQARRAVLDGADYLGCGPTFPSATKCFDAFPGVAFLAQVAGEIGLPAFAIGGIDENNIDAVVEAGITRAAVGNAVVGASDPATAARHLRQRLPQCGAL